jgi:large subunit ribosomal protein L22
MEARAIQRMVRQSPRKMRLVVDLIRGRPVPEAYAILQFSKKRAARQIKKVLQSAVANARHRATRQEGALDEDRLRVRYAVVNPGPTLKRYTSGAMGRAMPILKRTSHIEIRVAPEPEAPPRAATPAAPAAKTRAATPRARSGPASAQPKKAKKKAAKPKKTATRRRKT